MALQGSLHDLALPDVIQLVSVAGKTGVFTLSGEGTEGKIYLREGQVIDAQVGGLRGENALYEMAMWRAGGFIFTPGVEPEATTISRSNTSLMMEAARRHDEWRVLQRKIASLEAVPYFLPRDPRHDQITLSPLEWQVVTNIDGQRSVNQLEAVTGLPAFDVCKVLFGLITSGLIALREHEEKPAPGRPPGPSINTLLALVENVRKLAEETVGLAGSITVEKQYRLVRAEIEAGAGLPAVQRMIETLARAIALLEGNDRAAEFARRVKPLVQR
ncbi:MAG: hypothetical protein H6Q02_315 [Acidobacteria bacterium]|jgi:hypothetical protein|nr:hypothetical protein [Acidobacteriota bacterium]